MADPLPTVLAAAEYTRPAVTADDARWWPGWVVAALERADLLTPDAPATSVACEECGEGHVEAVEAVDAPGLPRRWFHPCPAVGRAAVKPGRLQRWAVRAETAGEVLSRRAAVPRLAGRVWQLGPVTADGRAWVGWLAAGWRGVIDLAEQVPELAQPTAAVFVPHTLPPAEVWGRSAPPRVIPLTAVLTLTADGLAVDPVALAAHLGRPDDPPAEPVGVTPPGSGPVVPLPAGTRWEDVAVEVDDHHLLVSTAGGEWQVGYEDAGFGDGRTGAPARGWALLTLLAKRGGELDDGDGNPTKSDTLTRAVSDLRAALCRLTGLTADPFHPTRRNQPYRTRFHVRTPFAPPSDR